MALLTFGTNATNTLSAFQWSSNAAPADVASINNAIKSQGTVQKTEPGYFANNGLLWIPTRGGPIRLLNGDWIVIGSTGMPFVMSNRGKLADFTSA